MQVETVAVPITLYSSPGFPLPEYTGGMMRVMAEEERRLQSLYYPPQDCNRVLGMDHHARPFHVSVGQACQVYPQLPHC